MKYRHIFGRHILYHLMYLELNLKGGLVCSRGWLHILKEILQQKGILKIFEYVLAQTIRVDP